MQTLMNTGLNPTLLDSGPAHRLLTKRPEFAHPSADKQQDTSPKPPHGNLCIASPHRGAHASHSELLELLTAMWNEQQWLLSGMRYASDQERQEVMKAVHAEVFPRFDLPAGLEGSAALLSRVADHMDDPRVMSYVKLINSCSGMDVNACKNYEELLTSLKRTYRTASTGPSVPSGKSSDAEKCSSSEPQHASTTATQNGMSRAGILELLSCLWSEQQWQLSGLRYASATERQEVMKAVHAEVFPRFGLPAGSRGNVVLLSHVAEHMDDPHVLNYVRLINSCSGMDAAACKEFEDTLYSMRAA